ncbi:MAG: CRTAC1 family protein [Alphaproteobacteria bacterium]|nr:CRTAC1 family protein [Alphaproteobacteria bacterium]
MSQAPDKPYRTWPAQLAVLATIGFIAAMAQLPEAPDSEADVLAARFAFEQLPLPIAPVPEGVVHGINQYAPQLEAYVHTVGASIAIGDLDGDGLANDLCYSDIRSKSVTLAPAPGTPERYAPVVVDFGAHFNPGVGFPGTCLIGDFNEDGLADLLISFASGSPMLLLRKDTGDLGPGAPLDNSSYYHQTLLADPQPVWHTLPITSADIDGDGHFDLVLGNYFRDGDRIHDPSVNSYFEMNDSFAWAENGGSNHVFLWSGATAGEAPSVNFVDQGDVFPGKGERRWTLAIGAADLDHDDRPEVYMANDHGPDQLLWNRSEPGRVVFEELVGEPAFNKPTSMRVSHDSFKGMGIDFADVNKDGLFDMYVSNIASEFGMQETHYLWMSTGETNKMAQGVAPYEDHGDEVGIAHSSWSWESIFDDFDNDGEPELVQATGFMKGTINKWADLGQLGIINDNLVRDPHNWPKIDWRSDIDGWDYNPFWVKGSKLYANLAPKLMPGLTPNTRGIATGDVDGDGDLDMAFACQWEDSIFLRNDAPDPGRFLGLNILLPVDASLIAAAPQPVDEVDEDGLTEEGAATEAEAAEAEAADAAPAAPTHTTSHAGFPSWREGTPAVGAYVTLKTPDGGERIAFVDGGNGHTGQRAPAVFMGLGDVPEDTPLSLSIRWRDRGGAVHEDALTLTPGWHTIVLANNGGTL